MNPDSIPFTRLMNLEDGNTSVLDSIKTWLIHDFEWLGNDRIVYARRSSTACFTCGDYNILYNYKQKTVDTLGIRNFDSQLNRIDQNSVAFFAADSNRFIVYETEGNHFKKIYEAKVDFNWDFYLDFSISPTKKKCYIFKFCIGSSNFEENLIIDLTDDKFEYFSLDSSLKKIGLIEDLNSSSITDRPVWDSDSSFIFIKNWNLLIHYYFDGRYAVIDTLERFEGYFGEDFVDKTLCDRYICAVVYKIEKETDRIESKLIIYDMQDNYAKSVIDHGTEFWGLSHNHISDELLYIKKEYNQYIMCSYSFRDKGIRQLLISNVFIRSPFAVPIE
ncbi:MAG: hypothetical protein GY839_15175 [candidate division Zixibacteria bacterium]|nr:hypothetical protein [candidate division Zixibacteria bacterium]